MHLDLDETHFITRQKQPSKMNEDKNKIREAGTQYEITNSIHSYVLNEKEERKNSKVLIVY